MDTWVLRYHSGEGVERQVFRARLARWPVFHLQRCDFGKVSLTHPWVQALKGVRIQWNMRLEQDRTEWADISHPGMSICYSSLASRAVQTCTEFSKNFSNMWRHMPLLPLMGALSADSLIPPHVTVSTLPTTWSPSSDLCSVCPQPPEFQP